MRARLPLIFFVLSVMAVSWGYGTLSNSYNLFPYGQIRSLINEGTKGLRLIAEEAGFILPWGIESYDREADQAVLHEPEAMAPGLTLVTGFAADGEILAQVVTPEGQIVQSWPVDWFEIWPNPTHLDKGLRPRRKPGTHLHGVVMADNGDLIFNFERSGMVRMDACGRVKWRLARRTHHSLHWDPSSQTFWTSGLIVHPTGTERFPNHGKKFHEYTVMEVSPDGDVLTEMSIVDLLVDNGLHGLLYLSTLSNSETPVSGDTLHVNDIETFPDHIEPGTFQLGDIMISLRNINAVMVFDRTTLNVKFLSIGQFLRHHDPDFIDGDTISVFDNNNLRPLVDGIYSKIVQIDATDGSVNVTFSGSEETPFFTNIMGKHQVLENGNMLITESRGGRALEVSADGRLVWEYINFIRPGVVGLLDEAQRLPPEFDAAFFEKSKAQCAGIK